VSLHLGSLYSAINKCPAQYCQKPVGEKKRKLSRVALKSTHPCTNLQSNHCTTNIHHRKTQKEATPGRGIAQVVEHLPSKLEALSSHPKPEKKKICSAS
jgi:hypothetical protein